MRLSPSLLPAAALAWAVRASSHELSLEQQQQQQLPLDDAPASSSKAPSYRADLLSFHKSLIEISSISGREAKIGNFLSQFFFDKGWTSTIEFVPPRDNTPEDEQRMNVIAWPSSDDTPDPKILLSSHIDVVPPFIDYSIDEGEVTRDTMIKGRGSVDAKGSVAAMVVALDELLKAGKVSSKDVMLAFVVGEEISGDGMRWFSDGLDKLKHKPQFDAVIFGEPTENKLACGHKGALVCELTAHGLGGHSGYPELGKSANELIVRAMSKILDTDLGSSEEFGNTTVNLGRMDGGVAANVIPEKAHASLMVRVALGPEETGAEIVMKRMKKIIDDVDDEALDFECSQGYGFIEANCDVKGFDTMVAAYGTDIPNLKGDFTKYLYGPGTILVAHGARENLTVGVLEDAVEGYQKLILHSLKYDDDNGEL